MAQLTIKQEALVMVNNLPEDSTWEDLMYEIYVRSSVEAGIADCNAGRVMSVEEVQRSY